MEFSHEFALWHWPLDPGCGPTLALPSSYPMVYVARVKLGWGRHGGSLGHLQQMSNSCRKRIKGHRPSQPTRRSILGLVWLLQLYLHIKSIIIHCFGRFKAELTPSRLPLLTFDFFNSFGLILESSGRFFVWHLWSIISLEFAWFSELAAHAI